MNKIPHHLYLALGAAIVLVLSFGIACAIYELVLIERNANQSAAASSETLAMVNQALKGAHKNGDDGLLSLARTVLQNGAGAANALKQTLQDANKIAKSQEKKTDALSDSSIALVKSGQSAIAKMGDSLDALNGVIGGVKTETLPKLDAGIDSLNGLVADLRPTAKASTALVTATTDDMNALHDGIDTANMMLADPDIADTIHSFKLMADKGVDTMGRVDDTMDNVAGITTDIHTMTTAATKPKSFFGKIWAGITVASRFAGLF